MAKQTSTNDGLDTPIQFCPGVGPKRAQMFTRMGVETIRDLFWHLPRGYEDFHNITPIGHVRSGETVTVMGEIGFIDSRLPRGGSRVRHILKTQVSDQSGTMNLVWFNQQFLEEKIKKGLTLLLHGKAEQYDYYIQMASPKFQVVGEGEEIGSGIMPIYPLSEGLSQNIVRKAIDKAFERFGSFCSEFLSSTILESEKFPSRLEAYRILHRPQPGEGAPTDLNAKQDNFLNEDEAVDIFQTFLHSGESGSLWDRARKRLVFEELLLHQLTLQRNRNLLQKEQGIEHVVPKPDPWNPGSEPLDTQNPLHWPAIFIQNLPFCLMDDQIAVCREIEKDLQAPHPMNRLLQGDVGSGKTVVSTYIMLVAVAGGYQAALMAPTEILAQQHANTIRKFTQKIPNLNVVALTGSAKVAERRLCLENIADGSVQIVVGTHALFQERVEFKNLGLAVVDEQHKFGVEQRQRLLGKGRHPDLLVATATPIPRTLSLTLFGDMDVSTIRSLPPGRPPLTTRWTTWDKEEKVWGFVDEKIALGQQVYVVCPIIDPSEAIPELPSTEEAFEKLSQTFLANRRVAILHGRHSPAEKEEMMRRMREREVDVVVATTVIEVGVDLPNATIMVVLGADRFGLAQLHQLRGRVGRGTEKSYCVLVTPQRISPVARQRMNVMEKTRDGFVIAGEDLKLRGPGEHFGARQSGHIKFRAAEPFRDADLLQFANVTAIDLLRDDSELEREDHCALRRELYLTYRDTAQLRPS